MFKNFVIAVAAMLTSTVATLSVAQAQDVQAHANSSIVQSGTFTGLSKHETSGGVSIIKTASGYIAVLESDFDLDGAPAPTLGFGNGKFDKKTEFTKLENIKGLQVYAIPASINPAEYSQFYVWCEDFNIPLGVASLK